MISENLKNKTMEILRKKYAENEDITLYLGELDISEEQLNTILKDNSAIFTDEEWTRLAISLGIKNKLWITAKTPVYNYLMKQLYICQSRSLSGLLCDSTDIGKTFAAKQYVRQHKNAVYIDCSQVKTKQKLIRRIAKEYGLIHTGRYNDVYEYLMGHLKSVFHPLIVLDEAGDLEYPAFLELKALWNATEYICGWYMMGADGLKQKIQQNIGLKKIGYTEIFSRFGSRYQKISPDGKEDLDEFKKLHVALISKANGVNSIQKIYAKTQRSLRRVQIEIQKS